MTVPIPDNVSWEEAGAIQPLAIAVQLARRASLNTHHTMAILSVLHGTPISYDSCSISNQVAVDAALSDSSFWP